MTYGAARHSLTLRMHWNNTHAVKESLTREQDLVVYNWTEILFISCKSNF